MFFKRFLVMVVGVLLFIGGFLLKYHYADAQMEDTFQKERLKRGVEGEVLTLSEAAPPQLPAMQIAPDPGTAAPPAAPRTSPSDTTPPPGSTSDPAIIIGPVPPAATAAPAADSGPASEPAPAPDTNTGGPMMPPSSSMNEDGPAHAAASALASYRPSLRAVLNLVSLRIAQGTNSAEGESSPAPATVPSEATNVAPSPHSATNHTTETRSSASTATDAMSVTNVAPGAARPHAASVGDRAIVLGYHQFTGPGVSSKNIYSMSQDVFESEMKYLHDNGYKVVPLSDVVRFVKHEIGLPPNAVAITIDDGYKSALNYAAPVLKQYGYPWTYFVYPAFITRTEGKGAASWPDLVELNKEGVDVECHSMTHPQLTKKTQKFNGPRHLLSPQEYDQFLTSETFGSKAILEKEIGKKIKYFAYPYGDYNKTVEARAVAAGYEAIFTVADNPVHITTDVHSIGRYIITKPVERAFAGYLRQGALALAEVNPEPGATISNARPVIKAVLGFNGDPASLETEVRDFGIVRHDFDPQTSTVRLYLPRDLIQPEVFVNIRARDEQSGQTMVANWHFNYEPAGGFPAPAHPPIASQPAETNVSPTRPATHSAEPAPASPPATNPAAAPMAPAPVPAPATNAPTSP